MSASGQRGAAAGVILVGGASARMGTPKHALRLADGRTMIEHVAAALQVHCATLVTVGGPGPIIDGCRHLADHRPGEGPLAGIEAALASGLSAQYIVSPCDLPGLTGEVVATLATPTERAVTVVRVGAEPRPRPLPARFAAAARDAVAAALERGNRSVRGLLASIDAEIIDVPAAWDDLLRNVNTPEDLERLRASDGAAGA